MTVFFSWTACWEGTLPEVLVEEGLAGVTSSLDDEEDGEDGSEDDQRCVFHGVLLLEEPLALFTGCSI